MNTKTCKHCGWIYPATQEGRKCKICGQPFDLIACRMCGKTYAPEDIVTNTTMCKRCYAPTLNENARRYWSRNNKKLQDRFDSWLEKVQAVPKGYPTLTEAQWLEACRYFDGCARCHSDVIDARGFFIGAKLGGRYCDWNIIPLCEKCASNWDLNRNIFKHAQSRDQWLKSNREHRDCLEKIVEYLGSKLDAANGIIETAEETTE